jgi:hypothetical protein
MPKIYALKVPVTLQHHTNVQPRERNIYEFVRVHISDEDRAVLRCVTTIQNMTTLNPKVYDTILDQIINKNIEEWYNYVQGTATNPVKDLKEKEQFRVILNKVVQNYLIQIRSEVPQVAPENIINEFRTTLHVPTIVKRLKHKIMLANEMAARPPRAGCETPEDPQCITCCSDGPLMKFKCGHSCCCPQCSPKLSLCPICRAKL